MRVLVDHRDADGRHLATRVLPVGGGTSLGPPNSPWPLPELGARLSILPGDDGGCVLRWMKHERRLARGESVAFRVEALTLTLTLLVDEVVGGAGACPRCGMSLRRLLGGGAYRSVARDVARCGRCGVSVLELEDAGASLGQFIDRTAQDWYFVSVPHRCPKCEQLLRRSELTTRHGTSQVERCEPCALLVLDDADQATLTGRRT
ncbi:MAG: hypothetical protein AAGH15_21900 [Myxococcota bacterium]